MAIEKYYSAKDLMEIFDISKSLAYIWLEQMNTLKVGNTKRVSESTLECFIANHQSKGITVDDLM